MIKMKMRFWLEESYYHYKRKFLLLERRLDSCELNYQLNSIYKKWRNNEELDSKEISQFYKLKSEKYREKSIDLGLEVFMKTPMTKDEKIDYSKKCRISQKRYIGAYRYWLRLPD